MPLDPYLTARIGAVADIGRHNFDEPDSQTRLAEFRRDPEPWSQPPLDIVDRTVPGPHGEVDIRVYSPRASPVGTLVWMHGGAFSGGDLDMNESHVVSSELASRTSFRVIAVGYRLATGGVRHPVPLDDVVAAWAWADRDRRSNGGALAIGGASAGAALALGAAIRVRDARLTAPDALLLAYPAVHFPVPALDDSTAAEMKRLPEFTRAPAAAIRDMYANYVGRIYDLPVLAVPGHATLANLPPVSIIGSELDEMRPSADLLLAQLADSGVPVDYHLARGMLHGHLDRTPSLPTVDESLRYFATALASAADRVGRSRSDPRIVADD